MDNMDANGINNMSSIDELRRDGAEVLSRITPQSYQSVYGTFRSAVDIVRGEEGPGRDISIVGMNDEREWENVYLAVRLIETCDGDIRIVTDNLIDTIYSHNTVLAHLSRWLEKTRNNKIYILIRKVRNCSSSRLYRTLHSYIEDGQIEIRALNLPYKNECDIKGALFGKKAFKFSEETAGKHPVFLGNFNRPSVVDPLVSKFDRVFQSEKLSKPIPAATAVSKIAASVKSLLGCDSEITVDTLGNGLESEVGTYAEFSDSLKQSILGTGERDVLPPSAFGEFVASQR
jgi:hypothetical protein